MYRETFVREREIDVPQCDVKRNNDVVEIVDVNNIIN